jgi:vancomycin resistance protein YoaR
VTDRPFRERTNDRRVIPWLLLAIAVLFGGPYVAAYALTSDRVPRGTTVEGVEIGGLTPAAAQRRLDRALADRATSPVRVRVGDHTSSIDPVRAGLRVDVPATVEQAGAGQSWDPGRMWDHLVGGRDLDAVVRADPDRLAAAVAAVAEQVDVPATEGRVTFTRRGAEPTYPRRGTVLDRQAAAAQVRGAFLGGDRPVELPTVEAEPTITKAAVSRAMDSFANPAVSGPVVVRLAGEGVALEPGDFAPALRMRAVGSELRPVLDDRVLLRELAPRLRQVARQPRDATVRLVRGRPQVVPARTGVTFDPADVSARFLAVLRRTGEDRTLDVESVADRPAVTTADARAWRIRQRVSSFTTFFPYASYRNTNLGRAASLVDGTVLAPGDTFSLNRTVGERTAANGFTKGFIISDGVFREDFGGGVSQVATTTFNAAFFAGLEDVEHKPHSFYIDRYPVGREATVAWPSVDLKFRNTTPYGVLVQAWIDRSTPSRQGAMHVAMWSTKHWDITAEQSARYNLTAPQTRRLSGPECVPNQGYGGFDIDVFRLFHPPGSDRVVRRERMHTTYTPSDTVLCS